RDEYQLGKADVEHGSAASAASARRVFVLLRVPRGGALAALVFAPGRWLVLVCVARSLFDALDRLAEDPTGAARPLGAEDEEHDHQHDDPMPDAETAHSVAEIPEWSGG